MGRKEERERPPERRALGFVQLHPDKDVARVPMKVDKLRLAIDQLTWNFADVTPAGGKLVLMWDTVLATAPFKVAK